MLNDTEIIIMEKPQKITNYTVFGALAYNGIPVIVFLKASGLNVF